MAELLPGIGAAGQWKLKPPFNDLLIANLAYTCKEVRKLSAVVASGIEAKAEFYDKYSIDSAVYDQHVKDDISIITIISTAGNWLHVPSPYLDGWPSGDAVPYAVIGMVANLGALPNTIDPSFLTPIVKNAVVAALGHDPDISYVVLSEVVNKTFAEHEAMEVHRQSLITDDNSDYVKRVKAEEALTRANAQIQALQQYIISSGNVPPPPP